MIKLFTSDFFLELRRYLHLLGRKQKNIFNVFIFLNILTAYSTTIIAQSYLNTSYHDRNKWQFANGPYEATLNNISRDPINPNILYICGEGVFRSTNGGEFWNDIEPDTMFSWASTETVIKADPNNPGIVYYGGNGALFKSYDYGENWVIIGFENRKVSSIEIDPTNSEIVYVGLDNSSNDAIWKSTNGGETWEIKANGIPVAQVPFQNCKAIKINPLNNNSLIAAVSSEGIYKSLDGGNNWTPIWELNDPLEDVEILPWDTTSILAAIALSPAGGLYKTTNNGLSWFRIFNIGSNCIEVSQITRGYFVGTNGSGVYNSLDEGNTWDSLNNPDLPISFSYALTINDIKSKQDNDNTIYIATGVGIYKSTNIGESWTQKFEGLNKFYAFDIKISPSNPSVIYTTGREGIHRSNDGGKSWKYIGGGAAENYITVDPANPDIVYVAHVPIFIEYWLWRTTNGGNTWEKILTSATRFNFIELDPLNYNILYTNDSQNALLKSTDKGNNWEVLNTPYVPTSIIISKENNLVIYIGSRNGVYKTINGGIIWSYLGLSENNTNAILSFAPKDENTIYAAIYGRGIFKTTDSGLNWDEKNNGLISNKFTQLRTNSKFPSQVILGFEDCGIYLSNNFGENWNKLEPEQPSLLTDAICIDTTGLGRIFTAGRDTPGIYILDSALTNVENPEHEKFPDNFILYQNYPNPFNPITTIDFDIPQREKILIEIFDLLGQKIKTLLNEEMEKGRHKINFNATELSSGIYFYRLITGRNSTTKKMIYLR